jgi:uncharacterized membrane protein HdeD (DUF308 family)
VREESGLGRSTRAAAGSWTWESTRWPAPSWAIGGRAAAGIAELVLGIWAVRSRERSLLTLVTLVGVWAILYGVSEIFAAFTLREAGKQAERLAD